MPVPPYLHLLNACPAVLTSTQCLSRHTYIYSMPVLLYSKKRQDFFPNHEIGRINGGRGFWTGRNVFRIGGNTFYDWKNKIPMEIPEFKRSGIEIIAEFHGIPSSYSNQDGCDGCHLYNMAPLISQIIRESIHTLFKWSSILANQRETTSLLMTGDLSDHLAKHLLFPHSSPTLTSASCNNWHWDIIAMKAGTMPSCWRADGAMRVGGGRRNKS